MLLTQLAAAIDAWKAYTTALVSFMDGGPALAFLNNSAGLKSADGTSIPTLQSQLGALRALVKGE